MSESEFKTFDQYAEEAKGDPFKLPVSKDETLVIPYPTGDRLMFIMKGLREGDIEMILASLCGDQWDRVRELFGGIGHKALPQLTEDMMDHFDLYEEVTLVGPGGGKIKKKRPTEIARFIDMGYRPAGEGPAS